MTYRRKRCPMPSWAGDPGSSWGSSTCRSRPSPCGWRRCSVTGPRPFAALPLLRGTSAVGKKDGCSLPVHTSTSETVDQVGRSGQLASPASPQQNLGVISTELWACPCACRTTQDSPAAGDQSTLEATPVHTAGKLQNALHVMYQLKTGAHCMGAPAEPSCLRDARQLEAATATETGTGRHPAGCLATCLLSEGGMRAHPRQCVTPCAFPRG